MDEGLCKKRWKKRWKKFLRWGCGDSARPDEENSTFQERCKYDIANVFGLKIFGCYVKDGRVRWRWWLVVLNLIIIWVIPSCLGFVANRQVGVDWQKTSIVFVFIFFWSLLVTVVHYVSYSQISDFIRLAPSLERCLTEQGKDLHRRWTSWSTSLIFQGIWSSLCVLGWLALFWFSFNQKLIEFFNPNWAWYMLVAIYSFYFSGWIWWIFAGGLMCLDVGGKDCLRMHPYALLETPGIRPLIHFYRVASFKVFVFGILYLALCLTPILMLEHAYYKRYNLISGSLVRVWYVLVELFLVVFLFIVYFSNKTFHKTIVYERRRLIELVDGELPQDLNKAELNKLNELNEQERWKIGHFQSLMQNLAAGPKGILGPVVIGIFIATAGSIIGGLVVLFVSG